MRKIQDDNVLYSLIKPYVDHHTRRSFIRYKVLGRKNIPTDGACIFGSNHCNTLMDAMVLLAATKGKKVFIARGDIFKNPTTANILKWIRILPIFRMRDGIGAVRDKNGDTISQAVDVLHDEVPLCLFPEATHRTKHSLRPLSKGIFHIALEANKQFGKEKPIYIVPVGLEYGDYFRFRSTVVVSFGKPINVTEYLKGRENDNEAVIINELKALLTQRMSELISFIPDDDEDYEAIWETIKVRAGRNRRDPVMQLLNNKKTIAEILDIKKEKPKELMDQFFDKAIRWEQCRKKERISVTTLSRVMKGKLRTWKTLLRTLLMLVGLPFFVAAATVTSPIWIVAYFILKNLKDKAFRNTVNFGVELVLHPLITATGMTLLFCMAPWEIAVIGSVFLYFSYVYFCDYCEFLRILMSDWRWFFKRKKILTSLYLF